MSKTPVLSKKTTISKSGQPTNPISGQVFVLNLRKAVKSGIFKILTEKDEEETALSIR